MTSKGFTFVLGAAAIMLEVACASTEKDGRPLSGGTVHDTTHSRSLDMDRPVHDSRTKQPSPSQTPQSGTKGPHDSSSPANQARDVVSPSVQRETSMTPLDQSEAPDDLETTRRIRQAVIQDDSLSFRAKNVTIVTNGDRVVLTGPVNTRAEANRIMAIAQSITPYRIEDRLQIRQ